MVTCGGLASGQAARKVLGDGLAHAATPAGETVTGFFLVEADAMDEATAVAEKIPIMFGAVEVREVAL